MPKSTEAMIKQVAIAKASGYSEEWFRFTAKFVVMEGWNTDTERAIVLSDLLNGILKSSKVRESQTASAKSKVQDPEIIQSPNLLQLWTGAFSSKQIKAKQPHDPKPETAAIRKPLESDNSTQEEELRKLAGSKLASVPKQSKTENVPASALVKQVKSTGLVFSSVFGCHRFNGEK